jgi:hypothetical protein
VGGEHVVVGGDDGEVRPGSVAQGLLVGCAGGEAVGEIGAAEPLARRPLGDGGVDALEIAPARLAASLGDAFGNLADALSIAAMDNPLAERTPPS